MKKTITSIAIVAAVTIASISTASAQSTNKTVLPSLVGPRVAAPANPFVVSPADQQPTTLVAPAVVQPQLPYVATPAPVVQPQVVPAPIVVPTPSFVPPATCAFLPKLEFDGRIVSQGMQVVSVNYDGLAHRLGLEAGDVITSINGQYIHCERDYAAALFRAAVYGGGNVTLQVRNVRWTPGCLNTQRFVTMVAQLPKRAIVAVAPVPAVIAAR